MSRDRRAAEAWPTREPEVSESEPRWASLADTGSLTPSDEALTWQRRADAWAQQAEVEPYSSGSQAVEPVNRWSEVASTGRPTFPADGVGWRTQTSEWRATGARWRQTTEWRSSTGSHVWRSTTEAWQSDEDITPEREKPAIAGTAWPTPDSDSDSSTPSWQQQSTPSWQQQSTQTPSWQESSTQTPSWQQSSTQTPSWQQPSTQTPSWQQPSTSTPSWQRREPEEPSWQRREQPEKPSWQRSDEPGRATRPVEQTWSGAAPAATPSWQLSAATTPSWQRSDDSRGRGSADQPPGENTVGMTRWERTEAPGWQTSPVEDAQHLVREDDRAAWRRDSAYAEQPPRRGRRRAPETDATPSGGTGWSTAGESDNWSRHTDTGNIQSSPDDTGRAPEQAGGRRSRRAETSRQATTPVSYAEPTSAAPAPYPGSPAESPRPAADRPRRGRPNRYNANVTDWREDTASWEAEPDTSNWTRDPDTGQWSRAEDDPRILAWRAEAARRESMKESGEEDTAPRNGRSRRAEQPSGGVPGGPLPSSGVPDGSAAAWPASGVPDARIGVPSTRPRSAMPGAARPRSAMPDATRPRSAMPDAIRPNSAMPGRAAGPSPDTTGSTPWSGSTAPSVPGAYEPGRGRRQRDDAAEPPAGGGRRRAPDPQSAEPWQAAPEPRPSRQSRRQNAEPEEYPTDGWRQGPLPPRQDPPRELPAGGPSWGRQSYGSPRELPAGSSPWPDTGRQTNGTPRDVPANGSPWPDSSRQTNGAPRDVPANGSPWPESSRQTSGGSRDLPTSGSPWPDTGRQANGRPDGGRQGYPARELPAGGPSWAEQEPRPGYRGQGPASDPWAEQEQRRPSRDQSSWGNQDGRRPYRDQGPGRDVPSWADPEPRPGYRDQGPARDMPSGAPSWSDQTRAVPSDEPSWADRETRRPGYGASRELPAGGSPRPDTARQPYPARELPAGPSWAAPEPRRPTYGTPRALPAGSGAWPEPGGPTRPDAREPGSPGWQDPRQPGGPTRPDARGSGSPSWQDSREPGWQDSRDSGGASWQESGGPGWQEPGGARWQEPGSPGRPDPRRPQPGGPTWADSTSRDARRAPYGAAGAAQWPDPLSQPRRASAPAYGASEAQRGFDDRDDLPGGGGYGQAPAANDWLTAERAARRGPQYRDSAGRDGETDWRQELSRDNALEEGESRRYDTSDFPPFRPSGSATVAGSSNLALSATSVISRVPEAPAADVVEEDTSWPPRRTTGAFQGTGSYERRPVSGNLVTGGGSDLLNPDDDEEDEETTGGPLAAVGYTVVWYGVPVILFVAGMFLLNSGQRNHALDTLAGAAPEFGVSLALSMLVAICLRWATSAWKSASVGLAAAVVGGGLATVLSSAITGNSLS